MSSSSKKPPSRQQSKDAVEKSDDEEVAGPSGLGRQGRRGSMSMPTGLDLLVKLAEYSWQTAPPINSSFDDLVEAASPRASRTNIDGNVAVVPARRRNGHQPHIPGRHPGPSERTITGFSDDDDSTSELSEPEFSQTRAAASISLNPSPTKTSGKGSRPASGKKRVGVRIASKDEEDEDDDICAQLKPLSARRKGSIAPIRITNSNFDANGRGPLTDEEKGGAASPTPSATSISSLLRDKLGQVPIPGMFRNKKPKEYKLQAFVAILFLIIILLVGSIYIIHKEKELQKSYFDRIRFSSKDRRMTVTNIQDRKVLSGVLGVNLNARDKPWPCLMSHQRENETCLEWMGKGRLYLKTKAPPPKGLTPGGYSYRADGGSQSGGNILCYGIYWEGLSKDFSIKDCYDMGSKYAYGGFVYGGGEMERDQWPLNKTVVPYSPFLTGSKKAGLNMNGKITDFQWGRSLRPYFVNSEGAAIQITDESPLHVSINHPDPGQICFGAAHNDIGFPSLTLGGLPFLNYTICTAENSLEISKRLADKDIWEGLKDADMELSYFMASKPLWRLREEILDKGNQSEAAILNHTDKIAAILPSEGFILFDESWQRKIGDLEGDPERFPNLAETFNITKRRGFKLALTVQPFVSTQSKNYVEGLEKGLWLVEKSKRSDVPTPKGVPALTEYKQWNSVAVLDVTQEESRSWLHGKVKNLTGKYGIEAVYADMGTCFDLPQHYQFSKRLPSADHAKDLFHQTLRSIPNLNMIGVSSAVKLPKPPTFVALSPIESTWEGLRTVIPNILSMGMAGFPFLIPGSIGGDYFVNTSKNEDPLPSSTTTPSAPQLNSASNETESSLNPETDGAPDPNTFSYPSPSSSIQLPPRELYIRWMQLVHFLPVVQYSFLPNDYDDEVVQIAQALKRDRQQKIFQYIKKAVDEAITTGMPIIRPIWMIDPLDANCLRVSDEFAIGDDIIVAPILQPNSTQRDIYLPRGIWKDELERSSTKGERWLHNYKAKQNQIPYFIKVPDTGQIGSNN